jgi:adenosylhomocysteine nucleosidase
VAAAPGQRDAAATTHLPVVHSVPVRIGMLAAMPSELRPLVRKLRLRHADEAIGRKAHVGRLGRADITAAVTGMGTVAAAEAARRMLDAGDVDHIVVVGIAGGIDDSLAIGEVVVPKTVIDGVTGMEYRPDPLGETPSHGALHTSDEFIVDPERLTALRARGVVALDMESAAIGAVCQERGCPWSVFRAISDRSSDGLADDAVFHLARPDGSPNLPAVARLVARQPRRIVDLVRLGRDARVATQSAAAAAIRTCGKATDSL